MPDPRSTLTHAPDNAYIVRGTDAHVIGEVGEAGRNAHECYDHDKRSDRDDD